MFFDPHDFEVTTNLKRAVSFVCDKENILTLAIVFKAEVKKKKKVLLCTPSSVCAECYRNLGCYFGWWQETTSQNLISHHPIFKWRYFLFILCGFLFKTPQWNHCFSLQDGILERSISSSYIHQGFFFFEDKVSSVSNMKRHFNAISLTYSPSLVPFTRSHYS